MFIELLLGALSVASFVVSIKTGHWFASPFAGLFAWGYAYVSYQVIKDQLGVPDLGSGGSTTNDLPETVAS